MMQTEKTCCNSIESLICFAEAQQIILYRRVPGRLLSSTIAAAFLFCTRPAKRAHVYNAASWSSEQYAPGLCRFGVGLWSGCTYCSALCILCRVVCELFQSTATCAVCTCVIQLTGVKLFDEQVWSVKRFFILVLPSVQRESACTLTLLHSENYDLSRIANYGLSFFVYLNFVGNTGLLCFLFIFIQEGLYISIFKETWTTPKFSQKNL